MAWLLALISAACVATGARANVQLHPGQSIHKDEVFLRELELQRADLREELRLHPAFNVPYIIPTTLYREREELGYRQNILIDPCKGKEPGCCEGVYGTPEYKKEAMSATSSFASGEEVPTSQTRWPSDERFYDEGCVEEDGALFREERLLFEDGSEEVRRARMDPTDGSATCLEHNIGRRPTTNFPVCWDFNSTVVSTDSCAARNGSVLPTCITIGYTQNAYIVGCGNEFADTRECGTFVELHRRGDDRILGETRLESGFVSGYQTTTMGLTYQGSSNRVVCRGNYELWWVLRTRTSWVVELRKPFFVELPECDFDIVDQRYEEYQTV